MDRMNISAMLLPILAVLTIVAIAGGLGVLFMVLAAVQEETWSEPWAVIALGLTLVVGVPTAAVLGQRLVEKE